MKARGPKLAAAAATLAAAVAWQLCPGVSAEVVQEDGVRVSLAGKMTPQRLPAKGAAPVRVSLAGHIVPTEKGRLPKLQTITIALNSHGRIGYRKVPRCRFGRISPSTTAEALAACGNSLVGTGSFSADVKIPEQSPFPSRGKLLAFNGKYKGSPAIFAHIYGTEPVPTSYVLPFLIGRTKGTYGTVLAASLPQVTGEWGYVTGVSLSLDRSYLSAGCPAPENFDAVSFPLMRVAFGFEGKLELTSTLIRNCRVKR